MSGNGSEENKVGYKQPPIGTRFKKGRSGNPGGRPKGIRSTAALADEALARRMRVPVDGKLKWISMEELCFRSLAAKAAQGNLPAIKQLIEWREVLVPVFDEDEVISFTLRLEEDDPPHVNEHQILSRLRNKPRR